MFKKYINENIIEDIKQNGYLIINEKKHLIMNIQNQPIEILNQNEIYEYIEDEIPNYDMEKQYIEYNYKLINNVIHKVCEIKNIENIEDENYVDNNE